MFFGNNKKGDVELMKSYSYKTKKFEYHEVSEIKQNNLEISSSAIRNLLRKGMIIEANNMFIKKLVYFFCDYKWEKKWEKNWI